MKCLYVDSCIRKESRTRQLAQAFLDNLKGYEVKHLILEDEDLKPLVGNFFNDRQVLLESNELNHPRFRYAHEFADADLVIIAAPFWDLSFPALLKLYIENISVDGITFESTSEGLKGLCKATNLVYLTTRGGVFGDNNPMDIATPYIEAFGPYYGFKKVHLISADGMDIWGYDSNKSLEDAKQKAIALAKSL